MVLYSAAEFPIMANYPGLELKYLWVHRIVVLLRSDPFSHELVAHSVSHGLVEVSLSCYVTVFHQSVVQVPVERSLDRTDVFQLWNIAHRNLLLAIRRTCRSAVVDGSCRHG